MSTGEKSFLLNWTANTLIAFVIALESTSLVPVGDFTPVIAGGITGLVMGVAQWLVLRQRVTWAYEWVVATAIGFFIPIVALGSIGVIEKSPLSPVAYVALAYTGLGTLVGISQWLALRRQVFHAAWWIPSNAAACLLGITPAVIVSVSNSSMHLVLQLLIGAMGGMTIGILTGATLVNLLRNTISPSPT